MMLHLTKQEVSLLKALLKACHDKETKVIRAKLRNAVEQRECPCTTAIRACVVYQKPKAIFVSAKFKEAFEKELEATARFIIPGDQREMPAGCWTTMYDGTVLYESKKLTHGFSTHDEVP